MTKTAYGTKRRAVIFGRGELLLTVCFALISAFAALALLGAFAAHAENIPGAENHGGGLAVQPQDTGAGGTRSKSTGITYSSVIAEYDLYVNRVYVKVATTVGYNNPGYTTTLTQSMSATNATNIRVYYYPNGTALSYSYQNQMLTVTLGLAHGDSITFIREYNTTPTDSDGLSDFGDSLQETANLSVFVRSHDVDIIRMDPFYFENYTAQNTSGMSLSIRYTPKARMHKLEYTYTMTNAGANSADVNATIAAPFGVFDFQAILNYTISPAPNYTRQTPLVDTPFYNTYLLYNFTLAPQASKTVRITFWFRVENIMRANITQSGTIPSNLTQYTLENATYWQTSNSQISAKAIEVTQNLNTTLEKIINVSKFVYGYLTYQIYAQRHGAAWAYANHIGDCEEYSDLTITMLRSAGIPAMRVGGHAGIGHAWVTAYVPGYGWYFFDPTWNFTENLDNTRVISTIDNAEVTPIQVSSVSATTPNIQLSSTDTHTLVADTVAPSISQISHSPSSATDMDNLTITAYVSDNISLSAASLYYRVNNGSESLVSMSRLNSTTYAANLGLFNGTDVVSYRVYAADIFGNGASSASASVTISAKKADLLVDAVQIGSSSTVLVENSNITIAVRIKNDGWVNASNATVKFYDGSVTNSAKIGESNISSVVASKGYANVTLAWNSTAGKHDIYISVNSSEQESDYSNNLYSFSVTIYKALRYLTNITVAAQGTSVYDNETVVIDRGMNISGRLFFYNSTIVLNCTGQNSTADIRIASGAEMRLYYTSISSADGANGTFSINISGKAVFVNSEISGAQNMAIYSSDVTMTNTTLSDFNRTALEVMPGASAVFSGGAITNCTTAVSATNATVIISASEISGCGYGVLGTFSNVSVLGNSFSGNTIWGIYTVGGAVNVDGNNTFAGTPSQIQGGLSIEKWIVCANVVDAYQNPVEGANAEIIDALGSVSWSGTTDSSGAFYNLSAGGQEITLTEYEYQLDDSGVVFITYTPHTFRAAKNGTTNYTTMTVYGNTNATVVLDERVDLSLYGLVPPNTTAKDNVPFNITVSAKTAGSKAVQGVVLTLSITGYSDYSFTLNGLSEGASLTVPISNISLPTGTYTITLTIDKAAVFDDKDRSNNTAAFNLTVYGRPVAAISGPATGNVNNQILFDASQSAGASGILYYFDFNDGAVSGWISASNATHRYTRAGIYSVSVKVKDTTEESALVYSAIQIINMNPVARAGVDVSAVTGQNITFYGGNSSDIDSGTYALNYTWNMGDNTTLLYGATVRHTYKRAGEYNVVLTVRDQNGGTGTDALVVTVTGPDIDDNATANTPAPAAKSFIPGFGAAYALVCICAVVLISSLALPKRRKW